MRLDLLGDQVTLGDFDLLVLGIAFEPDDLHPVEQRLRQVEAVGRGHEHHVRQVEIERSEEHTSELQSLMRISYAVFCLKKKKYVYHNTKQQSTHSNSDHAPSKSVITVT